MNPLFRARAAVVTAFLVPGFVLGMYAVNVPALKLHADLSSGALGSVFVFGGVGAIVGNQLAGFAVDRFGSRIVTIVGGILTCLAIIPPALAVNAFALAPLLFVFGVAVGGIDVGMNQQAVIVQRAYGRPIMAAMPPVNSTGNTTFPRSSGCWAAPRCCSCSPREWPTTGARCRSRSAWASRPPSPPSVTVLSRSP